MCGAVFLIAVKFVISNPQVHSDVQAHKDCSTSLLLKPERLFKLSLEAARDKDGNFSQLSLCSVRTLGDSQGQLSCSTVTSPWVNLVPYLKA